MTRPWEEIRRHYQELVDEGMELHAMLELVKKILSSSYVKGLFAWTSMHDLCIVQQEATYPYEGPYLRISPLFNGKIEFRYIDTAVKDKQWKKIVNENDAFSQLESFIEQLHWFVKENKNDS